MQVRQVRPLDLFPSGDSRALVELRFDPEELAGRYDLVFEERFDDLDWFKLAAIALPDEMQAWLVKYRGEREPGTTVYVDAGSNPVRVKAHLFQTLDLSVVDVVWSSPVLAAPATFD